MQELKAGDTANGAAKALGHLVGVIGMTQPGIILKHADPRSGQKTHLAGELAGLLVLPIKFMRQGFIEKDQRLTGMRPILSETKTEHIDTSFPRDLLGLHPQAGNCIGKTRAIHVHLKPMLPGNSTNHLELPRSVNRP